MLLHPKSEVILCKVLNFRNNLLKIKHNEIVAHVLPVSQSKCIELQRHGEVAEFEKPLQNQTSVGRCNEYFEAVTDVTKQKIDDFIKAYKIKINKNFHET